MWTVLLATWLASPGPDTTHWLTRAAVPEVSLHTLTGEPVAVPWANRDTVVVLWAAWCGPCVSELPVLADAIQRTGRNGLPVTLVSVDEQPKMAQKVLKRAVRNAPAWTSVWGGPSVAGHFGARTLPTTLVVSAQGTVKSVWTGHQDLAEWQAILTTEATP